MTLVHDLADCYHSFKSPILEPLRDVHIVGPILVVIDALDESRDATGRTGLHTFLAENLQRLPSNFRVLITLRVDRPACRWPVSHILDGRCHHIPLSNYSANACVLGR
jgi:hypothetical protein